MRALGSLLALVAVDQLLRLAVLHWNLPVSHGPRLVIVNGRAGILLVLAVSLYLVSGIRQAGAYCLLLAGILSNLLSQSLPGGLVDYIPLGFSIYSNGADLLVTGGAAWLIALLLRRQRASG